MEHHQAKELISPCGIYCGGCSLYLAKDRPEIIPMLLQHGVTEDQLPCSGCRGEDGNCKHLDARCEQYACAQDKGVSFCFECEDFPCNRLLPAADRANSLPHNMKMFAQCYIQKYGPEAYIAKLPEIRKRYFSGKISYGKGPLLPDD
ncbi:MAG: DUF3795 domain-containing protein [Candidatus Cloacimonetes bacterium]|jgi:hypothetical protein|nr:DUF3795 domain-containing protein [Candidatus Cloacimonadota bacterium]MDD4100732.1 DUF3795 domain-containing protein [Candidatus Cloacimonadota bacterium]MDD4805771.1 DUF3795 domain-containing protein [Candidatus Cloacimonadota bacterium]MDX9828519.1 DUF3795 domain-containing protein [Spirochaetia bacterium]